MGVIAVHRNHGPLAGVDTGEHETHEAVERHIRQRGGDLSQWTILFTRVPPDQGGYVGPENSPKWRKAHGLAYVEPPPPTPIGE
jgi:hypothetical protein